MNDDDGTREQDEQERRSAAMTSARHHRGDIPTGEAAPAATSGDGHGREASPDNRPETPVSDDIEVV
jgi:hypothetical protein